MSSTSSPIHLRDVHSRRTERWVAVLALAAAGLAPFLAGLPIEATLAYTAASISLAGAGFRRAGWTIRGDRRIVAVTWLADGRWLLTDRRGRIAEGVLRSDSRVGRHLVWLCWDMQGGRHPGRRSMLLAGSDVSDDELRRLSVRLRIDGYAGNVTRDTTAREISMA